eukprot:scaffold3964_cov336-Prasinococcus_capsulatus_cf.AAC.2
MGAWLADGSCRHDWHPRKCCAAWAWNSGVNCGGSCEGLRLRSGASTANNCGCSSSGAMGRCSKWSSAFTSRKALASGLSKVTHQFSRLARQATLKDSWYAYIQTRTIPSAKSRPSQQY